MNNEPSPIRYLTEANLVAADGRVLATGEAVIYTNLKRGKFFLIRTLSDQGSTQDSLPRLSKTLKTIEGELSVSLDHPACVVATDPPHFHFGYE